MKLLIISTVLVSLAVLYSLFAKRFNIVDKPNHRSSHTSPTIRGGGIIFLLAILIYFITSDFDYPYFVIGVTLIAIISFVDDIITLSSSFRLPFQFIAIMLCLLQLGFQINNMLIIIPLLIVGVGFINVYNFMDGINGITGFYSIIVLLGLLFINLKENIISNDLIIYVLLSLIIFGLYNFRKKARMFAGDIGSISIAVLLFFLIVHFIKELKAPILILLVLVYGIDAILTIVYRKSIGEKISEPHRKHIYQKLVHSAKFSHMKVAGLYAFFQAILCVLVYFGYELNIKYQLIIVLTIIIIFILIYVYLFKIIEKIKLSKV